MITGRAVGLVVLVATLAGCAEVMVYEEIKYREAVKEGRAPAGELVRTCNEEGLYRAPDGRWAQDQAVTQACLASKGWVVDSGTGARRKVQP
jgi:hypothetical protein